MLHMQHEFVRALSVVTPKMAVNGLISKAELAGRARCNPKGNAEPQQEGGLQSAHSRSGINSALRETQGRAEVFTRSGIQKGLRGFMDSLHAIFCAHWDDEHMAKNLNVRSKEPSRLDAPLYLALSPHGGERVAEGRAFAAPKRLRPCRRERGGSWVAARGQNQRKTLIPPSKPTSISRAPAGTTWVIVLPPGHRIQI